MLARGARSVRSLPAGAPRRAGTPRPLMASAIDRRGPRACLVTAAEPKEGSPSQSAEGQLSGRFDPFARGGERSHLARTGRLESTLNGHVWMTPADQGLFSGVALIVDAVMSSAFFARRMESAGPDVVRWSVAQSLRRARTGADRLAGFRINPLSCASPLGHPRLLCCPGSW
jgi:hypothetical protein